MLPEISLLKYILCYNVFNKYYKYININKYNYKELSIIYALVPKFFEKHGNNDASLEQFMVYFFGYYPRLKPEEVSAYRSIFEQASKADLKPEQVEEYVTLVERRHLAIEAASALAQFAEGQIDESKLGETLAGFATKANKPAGQSAPVSDNLEELLNATIQKPGLRWRLNCLNRSLGSLRQGDFGFVFARPETGKTTFLASEISWFATQTEWPILWFNNEEDGRKVKIRLFQAVCGVPLEALYSNIKKYQAEYDRLIGGRIILISDPGLHKTTVEQLVSVHKPAAIVIDQLDKVQGFDGERNDLVQGFKYQWARQLAVNAPVIGICQADGTGEGVKWLTMAHVADAKTAKQAEADFIVGIGKSNSDDEPENVRYLNVSKNKLFGDKDTDPSLRHGRLLAWIQPEMARYKDMGD